MFPLFDAHRMSFPRGESITLAEPPVPVYFALQRGVWMQDLDRALADISEIRSQLARGAEFRGYGAATLAANGALAAAAALAQGRWLPDPSHNAMAYIGLWSATAAVSVIM